MAHTLTHPLSNGEISELREMLVERQLITDSLRDLADSVAKVRQQNVTLSAALTEANDQLAQARDAAADMQIAAPEGTVPSSEGSEAD